MQTDFMQTDFMQTDFATTPRVIARPGILQQPKEWLPANAKRIFIVTDPGLFKIGLLDPIVSVLQAQGCDVQVYHEVEADPPEARVLATVAAARDARASLIIGLGGGSSMDTAKLVALLAATPQALEQIYGIGLATGPRLPLIQVPTTAGTGSEVTPIAIVTTPTHEKKGVVSPLLYPDMALLDAELTLGLPPAITAMTGIDAMVHAIEAYTSKFKKNPVSDALARDALKLMHTHLPLVLENGHNIESRSAMLIGSMMAGMAFANAPVGAVHALAYPLGGHFHAPHGLSNALVLAPVLRYNLSHAVQPYAELAHALSPAQRFSDHNASAQWFVDCMASLVSTMPFAQTLREVGVTEADLDLLASDAMKVERLLVNNPRPMTLEAARAIYAQQL
ncbi:Iron-containing alcohol dehydrogenase [gamma proteobacterium HdN1]|nr:Iron-containing alcohol dehydrogenase [gamma proteobacterium HdN1]